jgi:DNA repair protein RecO (recombination protein O)
MALKQSEAIVLRCWPLREADLLVTLLTRSDGRLKGVARSAMRSRKRFGGALEPLTLVMASWEDRERRELARLDSCEVLVSPLTDAVDWERVAGLQHVAEVLDEALPEREVNDAVFRLAWNVVQCIKSGEVWLPVSYFDLWMVRLMGLLPALDGCTICGRRFASDGMEPRAWFYEMADGVCCSEHKRVGSFELTAESRGLAEGIFHTPVEQMDASGWGEHKGADLRRFLLQIMERHLDRRLKTGMTIASAGKALQ